MTSDALRATAFRGDPDMEELHAFFQPERQYAGDTRWTFGTSLKSAFVNSFEFLNSAPLVQLWRDESGQIRAVSRITLAAAEWFYLADPEHRRPDVTLAILDQADTAFQLLSDHPSWRTVLHESDAPGAELLKARGYALDSVDEVYMTRSLETAVPPPGIPAGFTHSLLNREDSAQLASRADAQTDAFREDQPRSEVRAWMSRTLPNQLYYGRPRQDPHVIALDRQQTVVAFADVFHDTANQIGEFEPVGTLPSHHRRGLGKAVLLRGLELMKAAGMRRAIVRTGASNVAAIAAYESVGFEVTDRLMNYRKARRLTS